ncbi:DUF2937 family protein [Pseudidiomarina sp. 1APR75-15]|uniref:DUF2937 family protein n=1 Tax=Pseudidiomarina terrestris TaxID=2820060 RepID=A0ABT8MF09_9GAMM|nr:MULTISPECIES: DUF2937 family protein [unclassified Pseudidiomarina]MDN7128511.1 DUF2937 family protein [Pseudidiomarina sp. 1APR75-15]MEA3586989.1 DUF2937 family protein [Pseudidiomarina sp. 1APP75-27a]
MIYRYFILTLAACALLLGIQAPNLLTQYQQRLAAQYAEAMVYYRQYQIIADRYYDGEISGLIAAHEQNPAPAFQEEAKVIAELVERVKTFERQQRYFTQDYPAQLWSLAWQHDEELMTGTLQQYSFNVPLNQQAIATGALIALAVVVVMDSLAALVRGLWRRRRHSYTSRRP